MKKESKAEMENNMNSQDVKYIKIPTRTARPGNRYSYDIYDEEGNLILEAHKPLTDALKNHLLANNVEVLYYNPTKPAGKKTVKEVSDADLDPQKSIISKESIDKTVDLTKNIFVDLREQLNYSPGTTISKTRISQSRSMITSLISEMEENNDGVFSAISELKNLDDFYYLHSTNVSILGALLGTRLDYKREIRTALGVGGLIHDIGMTSVSEDILNKLDRSEEDYDQINLHPHVGYKIVEKSPFMEDLEKRILLLHHEKADGTGFPFSFDITHFKDQMPKEVRMIAIIDTYVSMVLKMPGQTPLNSRQALRALLNMVHAPYKKAFSFLAEDFRDFIRGLGFIVNRGNFFLQRGDLVRINSGEVAIIEEMSKLSPLNPKIRIVKNEKLENLKRPIAVDMLKDYRTYISNVFERTKKNPSK